MNRITENTLIPISLVISIIGVTIALSTVWYDTKVNAREVITLKDNREKDKDAFTEYQKKTIESLTRIETKLGIKSRQ